MKRKVLSKVGSVGKTTNNSDSDFDVLPMFPLDKPNRLQVKETTFNTYDYKLFGEIKGVDDYFDLIDALNYASPDDEFIIRIHSGGGSLGTADVIIADLRARKSHREWSDFSQDRKQLESVCARRLEKPSGVIKGKYKCKNKECKGDEFLLEPKQTRSSDEGETLFCKCVDCGQVMKG